MNFSPLPNAFISLKTFYFSIDIYGVTAMENGEGMKNKSIEKLAIDLVEQIRNVRGKTRKKSSDRRLETESINEQDANP